MLANVVDLGDFVTIKIKKSIFEKYNFQNKIDLILENDGIMLKPLKPRDNWDKAFVEMHKKNEDKLLIDDIFIEDIE
jgi:antitoxin MazE